jgi:hypothetical protein
MFTSKSLQGELTRLKLTKGPESLAEKGLSWPSTLHTLRLSGKAFDAFYGAISTVFGSQIDTLVLGYRAHFVPIDSIPASYNTDRGCLQTSIRRFILMGTYESVGRDSMIRHFGEFFPNLEMLAWCFPLINDIRPFPHVQVLKTSIGNRHEVRRLMRALRSDVFPALREIHLVAPLSAVVAFEEDDMKLIGERAKQAWTIDSNTEDAWHMRTPSMNRLPPALLAGWTT